MKLERMTDPHHPLYQAAMDLYRISFPPHEQRESFSQSQILHQDHYHFDVVCENGTFVGEILYWNLADFLYIEHFCILPAMRNKHYGQSVLALLQSKPLILEIDPPTDEISLRRKGFYERCGFVENQHHHIHPPYHRGNAGHELVIMSSPKALTNCEYEDFRRNLEGTVMNQAY